MSDQDALTPRVFLVRHGETEWAKSGRQTGATDIELTSEGEEQVSSTAARLVGPGNFLDPSRLAHVFVSPRKRARRTFELFLPSASSGAAEWEGKVTHTEEIAEWDYGNYEGLTPEKTRELRTKKGLDQDRKWDVWRDGCEGGESPEQISKRLDSLISQIRDIQRPHMNGGRSADVLVVAHGLILRCFVKRWLDLSIDFALQMMLAPGAIALLSYKNNNISEPAFHIGFALPSVEESAR